MEALIFLGLVVLFVFAIPRERSNKAVSEIQSNLESLQIQLEIRETLSEIDGYLDRLDVEVAKIRKYTVEQLSEIDELDDLNGLYKNLRSIPINAAKLNKTLNEISTQLDPDLNQLRIRVTKRADAFARDTLRFLAEIEEFLIANHEINDYIDDAEEEVFHPSLKKQIGEPFYFATHCGSCGSALSSKYICFNCSPLSD